MCVYLLTSYGWLSFLVKIIKGEFFNCFRSRRVYINRKFWVDMLYPSNEFTKSGHRRRFYVCFYEDAIWGMGCKNDHIFCSNWLTDFVHHLKWSYKTFLSMYAVEKTILPIQRSPEVKESPKKGEIEHFGTLCKIEK